MKLLGTLLCVLRTLKTETIFSDNFFNYTETTTAIRGQLSLYIGVSVAMVFEVCEIILDLVGNTPNPIQDGKSFYVKIVFRVKLYDLYGKNS